MDWFGRSYKQFDFEMYSLSHFVIMSIFILVTICIFLFRKQMQGEQWRKAEILVGISLILIEVTYHIWMLVNGSWNVTHSIPLELCSISLVLCIILLLAKKQVVLEILFFTALLGSTQSIFFPSLNYDFPHFRFFHFFYTHLMVVWVAFYFTWVKGFRPTFWSVIKVFTFLNILLPIILYINKLTNGNYLYLSQKPDHFSLLDVLGPYPWYIAAMDGLVITLSTLLWLIFRKRNAKTTNKIQTDFEHNG